MNERWLYVAASMLAVGAGACSSDGSAVQRDPPSMPRSIITPPTVDAETMERKLLEERGYRIWHEASGKATEFFKKTRSTVILDETCVAWLDANGLYTLVRNPGVWGYDAPDVSMESLVYTYPISTVGKSPQQLPSYTDVELKDGPFEIIKKDPDTATAMRYVSNHRLIFPLRPDRSINKVAVAVKQELEQDAGGNYFLADSEGKPIMQTMQVTDEAFPAALNEMCGVAPESAIDPKSPILTG